ncbi:hypothetical protein JZ751_025976 [Albula glossodonta]|uniref:Uncharacterized protein n=1 Tax=Albula glossodonta TaxID=121402 RepID=A0A8T2ND67_9TELE|nr:hypothetical protein JZ751_025976 [Albula glossodonta]
MWERDRRGRETKAGTQCFDEGVEADRQDRQEVKVRVVWARIQCQCGLFGGCWCGQDMEAGLVGMWEREGRMVGGDKELAARMSD